MLASGTGVNQPRALILCSQTTRVMSGKPCAAATLRGMVAPSRRHRSVRLKSWDWLSQRLAGLITGIPAALRGQTKRGGRRPAKAPGPSLGRHTSLDTRPTRRPARSCEGVRYARTFAEHGWIKGRTNKFEVRWPGANIELVEASAEQLVAAKPDPAAQPNEAGDART